VLSTRRSGPSRPTVTRTPARVRTLVGAIVLALAAAVLGAGPAVAQPALPVPEGAAVDEATPSAPAPVPTDAAGAAARLEQVQRDAEALTEQWHAAQDAVTARRAERDDLRKAVDPARSAAGAARNDEEGYRTQVDSVALTTFESGRLDTFNALLASGSPQDYLDQMSALEIISSDQAAALNALTTVTERTRRAQDDADAAAARAQTAADDAVRAEQDLASRKRDADRLVDEAEALLRRLTPRERADRLGPDVVAPPLPSGTGAGVRALRAAAAQLGKSYRWGATGPASFDCSGLTSFAFRQAGITLPRSSSQQSLVGRSVGLADLQPGDLVFFYNPVSHVGIYAGDGKMIHAPQTGDVVRYQAVNRRTFAGARRL
jgi:cell wall-associated NlpC family hydrolase